MRGRGPGLVEMDREELEVLGRMMVGPSVGLEALGGRSVGEFLAETLLKVRGKDGHLHPLRANLMQRTYERRRGAGNIVLKARQMGMTTWVAGRMLLKTVTRPGTLTLLVAHTQDSAEEILRIVHRFVEHLPRGLKAGALETGKANVRQIGFPAIDSEFRVESAGDRNAGRGLTFQNLHCSEVARWASTSSGQAADVLAGLRAGLAPGGEQVLESTADGVGGCFYEEWVGAEERGLVQHFFPWWLEPGYRSAAPVAEGSLTEEEWELVTRPGLGLQLALDLRQVGFRRQVRAQSLGLARQEYAETAEACFVASGDPYFSLQAVERRLLEVEEPTECPAGGALQGNLKVWLPPQRERRYLVAVDPAGGGADGDSSVMEVLDLQTGRQCAEYASHASGHELVEAVQEVCRLYNEASVVVERNNHGSGVLWLLEKAGYAGIFLGADGQKGFLTTVVSRPRMLADLSAALVETPELFASRSFLVECRSFVRLKGGGMGARSGAHDDRVMAMAIGLAARGEMLGRTQG